MAFIAPDSVQGIRGHYALSWTPKIPSRPFVPQLLKLGSGSKGLSGSKRSRWKVAQCRLCPSVESVASTSAPYEVAIEAKHGGKGWTARQLEHALRTQLAEDYLKPESRRHGVLVITHHRDRRWLDVDDKKPISFSQLIAWLSDIAKNLTENAVGAITEEKPRLAGVQSSQLSGLL